MQTGRQRGALPQVPHDPLHRAGHSETDEEGFRVGRGEEGPLHRPVDQVNVGRQGERRVPRLSGGLLASGMIFIN